MSLLRCNHCGEEVQSGLKNIGDHMEACSSERVVEVNENISAVYRKQPSFTVLESDLEIRNDITDSNYFEPID